MAPSSLYWALQLDLTVSSCVGWNVHFPHSVVSYIMFLGILTILVAFLWTCSNLIFCTGDSQLGHSIPGGAPLVSSRCANHFSLATGYTLTYATHYEVSFHCCSCVLLNQLVFHQVVCRVASIFAWHDLVQVAGFCISLLSLMRFLSALSSVLSKSVCKTCQDVFNPIFQIQDAVDII